MMEAFLTDAKNVLLLGCGGGNLATMRARSGKSVTIVDHNPVSFDLRRDIGIWAGTSALVHTAVGLNVHLRGRMWLYFVDTRHHLRRDAFGFGNYTGVLAALVFALLLALSNDVSLRRLGVERWKSLQRWAYAGVVLTAAHAIAYQQIEKRISPFQVVLYIVFGIVLAFQIAAAFKTWQTRPTP